MTPPDRPPYLPARHPLIPAVAHRLTAPAALAPDQYRSLLDDLATITDPRHRRGRRHTLGTVPAVAVAALHHQLAALPWPAIPVADETRDRSHHRVELRRLQVITLAGLGFPTPPRPFAAPAGSDPSAAAAGAP